MTVKTGRKFKCVGLKENEIIDWSENFTLNKAYYEAQDNLGIIEGVNNMLILLSDYDNSFCVDQSQFELIKN
ncbi:MAG: hypothetical protein HQ471_05040 [Flavobacteriales bacterium]|jgi:hypothetical protein|nr:hypothetical protein [Flavobacteriales bacterium]